MNQEAVRGLPEKDLTQIIVWAQDELRVREQKRQQDVIAKIKELAATIDTPVVIGAKRGRPSGNPKAAAKKAKKV